MTAKSKAEMMKRLRAERKAAGLVEVRLWVDPADVDAIKAFADLHREAESVVEDKQA